MTGRYEYNIDQKGRISIPSKMREELGGKFVVSKGLDDCLKIYPMAEWDKLMQTITNLPFAKQRIPMRFYCEKSQENELDKQGRFCLSQELRDFAGLTDTAVIIGMYNTIEIWNKERWEKVAEELTTENIESMMEGF